MDDKKTNTQTDGLIHNFNGSKTNSLFSSKFLAVLLVLVILGIVSGYILVTFKGGSSGLLSKSGSTSTSVSKGTAEGSNDTKTFKDTVEGVLRPGGIEDEGTFHLERPGGESQNVYLTSSIVDLSKYADKKIKVWGQTQKAQHAGWLMDVGRVEVL